MPSLGGPWFASRAGHPPPAKPKWWQVSVGVSESCHVCLIRSFMFHHSTVPQPPKPYAEASSWHLDASNGYARKTVAASASLANSAGKVISWIGGEKNNWRQKTINNCSALSKVSRFRWFLMNTAPARDEMTPRWLTHQCRAEVTGPWKDLQKGGLSWVVPRCL